MTDEFEDLKAAMQVATPELDAARKAATLRAAEEEFAWVSQGLAHEARPRSDRGVLARVGSGVTKMMDVLTSKGGLAATTALVAVGFAMVTPVGRDLLDGPWNVGSDARVPRISVDDGSLPADGQISGGNPAEEAQVGSGLSQAAGDGRAQAPEVVAERDQVAAAAPEEAPVVTELADRGDVLQELTVESGAFAADLERRERVATAPVMQAAPSRAGDSIVILPAPEPVIVPESDTEAFSNADTSSLKVTTEEPVSTFSIDVDTASYAVVRSSLTRGALPPQDAVRVEEMVNYFPYAYPAPEGPHPFESTITVMPSPWNAGTELVHIGIQGTLLAVEDRPPLNLVFLIDTSGSMQDANKLPLLKQSFRLMLAELRPEDEVSIVTYAGSAGQVLEPTRAAERSVILGALDRLEAGGSTAGQAGLQQAYAVAEGMAEDGEVTRVVLATDGDFNVGLSDPEALKDFIAGKREIGTYLSVLGFGRGNLDDATMQALAQNGNGTAAYIDTLSEARKVLVDQLTGALFPIANDVKIQVEFNPAEIAEYRLIGYETRALAREDFNNDRVDAGDIGAGHTVTAIYEVTPVGSEAIRNGPLRYGQADTALVGDASGERGFFKLRYKEPGSDTSILIEEPIFAGDAAPSEDVRFSVAMAGFGELLRGGEYLGGWDWAEAIALASGARGEDAFGYRAEAVTLMRLAEMLSK